MRRSIPRFTPLGLCTGRLLPLLLATLLLGLFSVSAAAQGGALLKMVGGGNSPLVDPDGYFSLILPSGFDCEVRARRADCKGTRGAAKLTIAVREVPWSATADLAALNEMDNFKKKEHFKLGKRERIKLSGQQAVSLSFSYDHFGNVEHRTWVQAVYLVQKNKLYVIHFEARSPIASRYTRDLGRLLASFRATPLDDGGHPDFDQLFAKEKKKHIKIMPHGY